MSIRSVARRLAVTLPFFSLAAVVLGLLSNPVIPDSSLADSPSSLILIVTTESLHPAFRALEMWNRVQGCPSDIVSFEPGSDRHAMVSRLAALCRERRATGLLLGGNTELVPLLLGPGGHLPPAAPGSGPRILPVPAPRALMPEGMTVGRAPVGDLAEAWAFVNACRTSGRTLDQLMSASASVAVLLGGQPASVSRSLLYSALARPIH
jgi:hypothetical protein